MCGEHDVYDVVTADKLGSPPHVRGASSSSGYPLAIEKVQRCQAPNLILLLNAFLSLSWNIVLIVIALLVILPFVYSYVLYQKEKK